MINFNTGVCIKQIFVEGGGGGGPSGFIFLGWGGGGGGGGGVHPIVFSWSDWM